MGGYRILPELQPALESERILDRIRLNRASAAGRNRLKDAVADRQGLDKTAVPRAQRTEDAAVDYKVLHLCLDPQPGRDKIAAVGGDGKKRAWGRTKAGGAARRAAGIERAAIQRHAVEVAPEHDIAATDK